MEKETRRQILSGIAAADFVGAEDDLSVVLKHANETIPPFGLLFHSPPTNGASELLKQVYDQLFFEQGDVVPIYVAVSPFDNTREAIARRFLRTFLLQLVAFRRNDSNLCGVEPDICEIAKLAKKEDADWIDEVITACDTNSELVDNESFIRQALSAPIRAAVFGINCFVIIDDLHYADDVEDGEQLFSDLSEIYSKAFVRFVFSGRRRALLSDAQFAGASCFRERVKGFGRRSTQETENLLNKLSEKFGVKLSGFTRNLLAQQFFSNPLLLNFMFSSARTKASSMRSVKSVEEIYTDELLGGHIGRFFDALVASITSDKDLQKSFISALSSLISIPEKRLSTQDFLIEFKGKETIAYRGLKKLNVAEVISLAGGLVEFSNENSAFEDYVSSRFRLEIKHEPRAKVVADTLAAALKRAPEIMARSYRRSDAAGVREVLSTFNCQELPLALFDYTAFRQQYKGDDNENILEKLMADASTITLPQIVFTAYCSAFYPPIRHVVDDERCAVGMGFESARYTSENEVVWIVAEVESKLEVTREIAEFWCDRLEMVALMCNFSRQRIWLIAPEGFDEEAMKVLRQRNGFGSSRKQIELLTSFLKVENLLTTKLEADEYEMTVPMGDDTELIAAYTVEEIARRHKFGSAAINQIKTALIEACINAAEHSHSPDKKIYQRFSVAKDRLIITVENRGIPIPSHQLSENGTSSGSTDERRGWGLKLIRLLMDEVKFEQTDDGTKITMSKLLR